MLSIVIHYSCDRKPQLINTITCLEDVKGTEKAEKLLLVDGKTNIEPEGWKVIEVERDSPEFYNCSKIWNLGFKLAQSEIVLTLESDRILPRNWLYAAFPMLSQDFTFIANKNLFSLTEFYPLDVLKDIRDNIGNHKEKLIEDHRVFDPNDGVGRKNPMSGCLLTTKTSFEKIGKFDEGYLQAGYHDLDAFRKAFIMGAKFLSPPANELHQKHDYAGGMNRFKIVNLWNAVRYHQKWKLELHPNIQKLADSVNLDLKEVETAKIEDLL